MFDLNNKWFTISFIVLIIVFFIIIILQIYYYKKKEDERKNIMIELENFQNQINNMAKKSNEYVLSDKDIFELLTNYEKFESDLGKSL